MEITRLHNEALTALSSIEGFSQLDPHSITSQRLGGLTNRNYRIDCEHGRYVLRLAGDGTNQYIDRKTEYYNASIASEAGVNAEIIYFNDDDGTMVCRYIDQAVTLDIEKFRDAGVLARTGRAFRQLHDCQKAFRGQFELFQQIDQYRAVLNKLNAELPAGYEDIQHDAERVRDVLSLHTLPNTPCHCDPMVENCIDDGERVYIIDFEYAGNNDPMWDLGDLSVEGHFSDEQDNRLMTAYFGREPSRFDRGRMILYKAMCDLLWTLWGVVQHANGNPAEDFWAYAVERLDRCRALMGQDHFARHLESVRRGPGR